jgi:pimeloyl-ACP methyl ester carboxylesterase
VAEGARLESVYTGNRIEGSNPPLSAMFSLVRRSAIRLTICSAPNPLLWNSPELIAWEGYTRLPAIRVPTLVIHGESDRLVPAGNGRIISERIPDSELVMIPRASHIFFTDQTAAAHDAILRFLAANTGAQRKNVAANASARVQALSPKERRSC